MRSIPESEMTVILKSENVNASGFVLLIDDKAVKIHYGMLEQQLFRSVREIDYDILTLIGAVEFADKRVKRRLLEGWGRSLRVSIPVSDPKSWNEDSIRISLIKALHFLTGDNWDIRFTHRNFSLKKRKRPFLHFPQIGPVAIIPYSDGLDSFAFGQLLKAEQPDLVQLRVTAWNRSLYKQKKTKCEDGGCRVSIPISSASVKHAETSFRTRPFKFLMLCALVAGLIETGKVYVPENGQGVVGPSLIQKGEEWTYWGSHPLFTRKLKRFIKNALGFEIYFEHPNMWLTKGQVLKSLLDINGAWEHSISCSCDQRQGMSIDGSRVHCGVCANCLLRRVALYTAGLGMNPESYIWPNLGSRSFSDVINPSVDRKVTKNDMDMANCSIIALNELANYLNKERAAHRIDRQAYQLSRIGFCSEKEASKRIKSLLIQHENEWANFVSSIDKPSWFYDILEAMK